MKNFYHYKVSFEPFVPDLISGIFWSLDISGITEEDNFLSVYSQNDIYDEILEALDEAKKWETIKKYEIEKNEIENKDWNEEWEKKIDVIEVTENIVIKPTFRIYHNFFNKIVIEIDPKMSFGTGEHETTRLIIRLLKNYIRKDDKVLDAGSGTGILSIVATKLGAESVTAFDVDQWCYINGKENAELNKVKEKINFVLGDISEVKETGYDLILANINLHILMKIAGDLYEKAKEGGKIILSGLLRVDENKVIEKYVSFGFKHLESKFENEWGALVFEK